MFFKLLTDLVYDSFVLQMLHNATQLLTDSKKLHTSLIFLFLDPCHQNLKNKMCYLSEANCNVNRCDRLLHGLYRPTLFTLVYESEDYPDM